MHTHWLWQQYSGHERLGAQLSCSYDSDTLSFFRALIWLALGNGDSTLFWLSPWLDERTIEELAPELFAVVSHRAHRSWTVPATLPNHV
jgi:hypothetical protein